jgi:glycosyltransferase involved in cell wall biosynthesis
VRIAVVSQNVCAKDGQGRVNLRTVLHAVRGGHEVVLVAHEIDPQLRNHPGITWVRIDIKGWPIALLRGIVFSIRSAAWLRRHRPELDVIHVNGCVTAFPGDVNAAHTVHGAWIRSPAHTFRVRRDMYGFYQYVNTWLNAKWERRAFLSAKSVVAVSDQVRTELEGIGVPPERITVIVNGVDLDSFRPGASDRAALGLPEGVCLGLFVGDIRAPRKNLETVLKALVDAPDVHLAVCGRLAGSPYPRLADQLGVADRAHFLDFRTDIPDLMRSSDVFVFPSRYEACSLVILEALASGLPVVTARVAGGSEVVTKECGFVLEDADDVATLSKWLRLLHDDPELRRSMGISARRVAERYSWSSMADSYLSLYEDCMRTTRKPTIRADDSN